VALTVYQDTIESQYSMFPKLTSSSSSTAQPTSASQLTRKSRLVLVRHGKPEIQGDKPPSLWPLSQSGREATASLADKLRGFTSKKIKSSPESKAFGTAEIIAEKLALEVEIDKDLAEHERHSTSFLPREEFEAKIAELFNNPDQLIFGDEAADAALDRFKRALDKQHAAAEGDDVMVVTHGTVLSIYVSWRLGVEPFSFWQELGTPIAVVISGDEMEFIRA
jgi:broad specificity phosphatase PhoE